MANIHKTVDKPLRLKGKEDSWKNFFRVMYGKKHAMIMADGSSLGNFWAFVQHLEEQYRDMRSKVVLNTGGAKGSDYLFERLGEDMNYNVKVYSFEGHNCNSPNLVLLGRKKLDEASKLIKQVAKSINRKYPSKYYTSSLIKRNYWIIKNSKSVYMINMVENLSRGTLWGFEIAKRLKRPIYLLDVYKGWFKYNYVYKKFIKEDDPPTPEEAFAGIGTRKIPTKRLMYVEKEIQKLLKPKSFLF